MNLLHEFFNTRSDAATPLLAEDQERLEKEFQEFVENRKPTLPSKFTIDDEVSLSLLADLLLYARDGVIKGVNFTRGKVKYNLQVPIRQEGQPDRYFRMTNIDSAFVLPKNENGFQYNSKVIDAQREIMDKLQKEVEDLRRWKKEFSDEWFPVMDFMREHDTELRIGDSMCERLISLLKTHFNSIKL